MSLKGRADARADDRLHHLARWLRGRRRLARLVGAWKGRSTSPGWDTSRPRGISQTCRPSSLAVSPDGEAQVGDLTRRRKQCPVKGNHAKVWRIDETDAVAQQDRYQVDHDLVEQAGTKALHCEVGSE